MAIDNKLYKVYHFSMEAIILFVSAFLGSSFSIVIFSYFSKPRSDIPHVYSPHFDTKPKHRTPKGTILQAIPPDEERKQKNKEIIDAVYKRREQVTFKQ